MSDALKPCPFCGSRGIDRNNYWHRDYCTNCGANGPAAGNSPKAAWNTRATDDNVQALVDALEFVRGKISWEINPSNYDHQEVCDMNADWCEIGNTADAALAKFKGETE